MIGEIGNILQEMEDGVYNLCKDGKCTGCGECCSALLPISEQELKTIKRYVKKHNIKPHRHDVVHTECIDLACPFLNTNKENEKCDIYKVRPKICRVFKCDTPPSKVKEDKEKFWKERDGFYMWNLFR